MCQVCESWEMVNEAAQIRATTAAEKKTWEGTDFIQPLFVKQVPCPTQLTEFHNHHRVVSPRPHPQICFCQQSGKSQGQTLSPGSNTCWLFDLRQVTEIRDNTCPAVEIVRRINLFSFINTKHIFIKYTHEGFHENQLFEL